jgi:hypothetical protein
MRPPPAVLQPQLLIETRYIRDAWVPISADDPDMLNGWRAIPIPPTEDDAWQIFDEDSRDRYTGWRRVRLTWEVAQ